MAFPRRTNKSDVESDEQRFNRAHICGRDFEKSLEFIEAARARLEDSLEYEAFIISAIVSYARPFSGNERSGKARAASKFDVSLDSLQPEDQVLHRRLIDLRNQAIAHAEWGRYPVEQFHTVNTAEGFATTARSFHIVSERIDLDAFARIAHAMKEACVEAMFKYRKRGISEARR
jgi:hypothetical protein